MQLDRKRRRKRPLAVIGMARERLRQVTEQSSVDAPNTPILRASSFFGNEDQFARSVGAVAFSACLMHCGKELRLKMLLIRQPDHAHQCYSCPNAKLACNKCSQGDLQGTAMPLDFPSKKHTRYQCHNYVDLLTASDASLTMSAKCVIRSAGKQPCSHFTYKATGLMPPSCITAVSAKTLILIQPHPLHRPCVQRHAEHA